MTTGQSSITTHDLYWVLGEQDLGPVESYLAKALKKNGKNVNYINIHKIYSKAWKKLNRYSHRLPRKYDNAIQQKYFKIINEALLKKYLTDKPRCIFIYNGCNLYSETIELFKKHGTKIIIFLGDDPNYLFPAMKTFLLTVMNADIVITPDTGWIAGLELLDVKNIIYSPIGTDAEIFFPMIPKNEEREKYAADILFVGAGYYLNSWGIRRAAILNELADMDFRLFGNSQWYELFPYFPKLHNHFINQPLDSEQVNIACNSSKIYPVLINHGVINGVSTRVFDCIASGIFIIAEYRKDLDELFPGNEVIYFKSKKELADKTKYFLKNENEMKDHAVKARKIVLEKYTLEVLVKNILEQI